MVMSAYLKHAMMLLGTKSATVQHDLLEALLRSTEDMQVDEGLLGRVDADVVHRGRDALVELVALVFAKCDPAIS